MPVDQTSRLIAIIDDDEAMQDSLRDLMEAAGLVARCFGSAEEFLSSDLRAQAACLIVDIRMPKMSGLQLQVRLKEEERNIPIIFITAHGDARMRIRAMREGAVEFLAKPFDHEVSVEDYATVMNPGPDQPERTFERIIGKSAALESVLEQVEQVAPTDSTILIEGETGTGKELIAHAIHNASQRCGRAFIKLNCAAIPLDLLESELFGHEKGAFTGAIAQKMGRFEMADKGTLFLDEVGDIPPALQPKLLRILQEQEFERLGSGRTHKVDVRLVAATNRNLAKMVARGQFRSDLYYRLNVFPILLPALRERREDIPALITHFVRIFTRRMGKQVDSIPPETLAAFQRYSWPGNIRELQNLVERAVILSRDGVLPNPLHHKQTELMIPSLQGTITFHSSMTLEAAERALILETLEQAGWIAGGPRGAAAKLGLKRTTLLAKMRRFGISRPILQEETGVPGVS
jgi:formate hydrogenlyase transcriptional activator